MTLQLLLCILASCCQKLALAAPHGNPHCDFAVAETCEPCLVSGHVLWQLGDEQISGDPYRCLCVVLLEYPPDELWRRERLHLLHNEAVPADNPPAPNMENLHRRGELVLGNSERVQIFGGIGHHLLALDREAHSGQAVAQTRRPLELELGGRSAHLGFEAVDDGLGVAIQELHQLGHESRVLLVTDRADTGARTPLDVIEQAGPTEELMEQVRMGNDRSSKSRVSRIAYACA